MRQCLAEDKSKLIVISGRGGVGKTSLVAKLVRQLQDENVVYLSLVEPENRSLDRIVEVVSRTLAQEQATELRDIWQQNDAPLQERLARLFKGPTRQRVLVILDNLESVLDEDNRVAERYAPLRQFLDAFLEFDHATFVIATSRRSLMLSPEAELGAVDRRVHALDGGLPERDAIELLRHFDGEGRELGIRAADDAVLRDLVRRCQGIPRTLETVVVTLRQHPTWTLDTLLAKSSTLAALLENPARQLYTGLASDQERLVMQVLAVYNKPVPGAAIRFILPALPVDTILDRFVLDLIASHDRGRFWLHPLRPPVCL